MKQHNFFLLQVEDIYKNSELAPIFKGSEIEGFWYKQVLFSRICFFVSFVSICHYKNNIITSQVSCVLPACHWLLRVRLVRFLFIISFL